MEVKFMHNFRERCTLLADNSFMLCEYFRIGENLSYAVSESPTFGTLTEGGPIGFSYLILPIVPVYDVMGNFAGQAETSLGNANNPVAIAHRTRNNSSQNRNLFGNVFAEWDLFENLM